MKLKIFNKMLQPKVGVLVNIVMGASLHQHGHSHGGGGGHGDAEQGHGSQHGKENINVKAAFIHVIGDFLQSLGRRLYKCRTDVSFCGVVRNDLNSQHMTCHVTVT